MHMPPICRRAKSGHWSGSRRLEETAPAFHQRPAPEVNAILLEIDKYTEFDDHPGSTNWGICRLPVDRSVPVSPLPTLKPVSPAARFPSKHWLGTRRCVRLATILRP